MRACESCSACCKVTRVRELNKSAGNGVSAASRGGRGCTIDETRVEVSRTVKCR